MKDYDNNSVDRRNNVIFINDILASRELQEKIASEKTSLDDLRIQRKPAFAKIIASVTLFMATLHMIAYYALPDYGQYQDMHIFSLWLALGCTFVLSMMSLYGSRIGEE